MKQIVFFSILILFSTSVFSQEENSDSDDSLGLSGYLCPFFETTSMVKQCNYFGGVGGIFVTPNIIVGGFGKAMLSYFKVDSASFERDNVTNKEYDLELDFGGGGLVLGYRFMPTKKIRPIIMLWAGGGSISLSDKTRTRIKELYDDFFIFNGTVEIDYQPLKFLSVGIGAHYQIVSGLKLDGYKKDDFNGGGLFVNIKLGSF